MLKKDNLIRRISFFSPLWEVCTNNWIFYLYFVSSINVAWYILMASHKTFFFFFGWQGYLLKSFKNSGKSISVLSALRETVFQRLGGYIWMRAALLFWVCQEWAASNTDLHIIATEHLGCWPRRSASAGNWPNAAGNKNHCPCACLISIYFVTAINLQVILMHI